MVIPNMRLKFVISSLLALLATGLLVFYVHPYWAGLLAFILPIIWMGAYDMVQTKHALRRNFPLVARLRYIMESVRPGIYQYFIESDLNGRPFSRRKRTLVYQRAKKIKETVPFGTQIDIYAEGYAWMTHSTFPNDPKTLAQHPTVRVGGATCTHPYDLSIFNVSAMSFGSLSKNAVLALNKGAKKGAFAHNTGEGGISPYHLEHGGDLIWQVGTGYFGCRAEDGNFSPEKFKKTVAHESVKMVELKLSQGAKPGHGGILPAQKNTLEIAKIRGVEPHKAVLSPPFHKAFNDDEGLLFFIQKLRELSGGKPIGFKLCIGGEKEFYNLCKAMIKTGIKPDFISVDGGEGGTGAAPVEFSDSLGMPLLDGLSFVIDTLRGFDLKKEIRVLASGRITCGFDIAKIIALGTDACYSARAMMMALGCIQALECHSNNCPTGVATQNEKLANGLVVTDKAERVYNFHEKTVHAFVELIAAAGLESPHQLKRKHIYKRTTVGIIKRFDQLFPNIPIGCLLNTDEIPEIFKKEMLELLEEED